MNKISTYVMMGLALFYFSSCHQHKESNVIITEKPKPKTPVRTQSMNSYSQSRKVNWVGEMYTIESKRQVDKSLPEVNVDENTRYYDNCVSVKILRKDGSVFFQKDFHKTDFDKCIDEDTNEHGTLLGVVFAGVKGNALVFAASVGSPDATSDEYIPLVVKISHDGSLSITRDSQMDTSNTSDAPEDEEGE